MKKKNAEIPPSAMLPGGDRSKTDKKTNMNIPSEEAVKELRRWSEQRQQ